MVKYRVVLPRDPRELETATVVPLPWQWKDILFVVQDQLCILEQLLAEWIIDGHRRR